MENSILQSPAEEDNALLDDLASPESFLDSILKKG